MLSVLNEDDRGLWLGDNFCSEESKQGQILRAVSFLTSISYYTRNECLADISSRGGTRRTRVSPEVI